MGLDTQYCDCPSQKCEELFYSTLLWIDFIVVCLNLTVMVGFQVYSL